MANPIYTSQLLADKSSFIVIDISKDDYNSMDAKEREKHIFARIQIRGPISESIARLWAARIADQLNSFEAANLAVASLTPII